MNNTDQTVLQFITRYSTRHRMAPTLREIGTHTFLTEDGARKVVSRLCGKGYLTVEYRKHRGIKLTGKT